MRRQVAKAIARYELPHEPTRLVSLVKDGDHFDVVIGSTGPGVHQLQLLWNQRPFISSVFERGTADRLLRTAMNLKDELIGRGWRLATE